MVGSTYSTCAAADVAKTVTAANRAAERITARLETFATALAVFIFSSI
jgi:hypothetical protein